MFRFDLGRAACALVVFPLLAAAQPADDAVVVTATRFEQSHPGIPASMTVITREEVRRTPGVTLLDVLKSQTGVVVTPVYGPLGIDATLDLRGFGDTALNNTLILLDGQRLNAVSADAINWSAIPRESVQRIEIIRGGGTVLYGDRATGGVVNIVTDKSGTSRASAAATAGSHGYRGADAFLSGGGRSAYFTLAAHHAQTQGYRRNSQQDEQSLAGRVGLGAGTGAGFVDYSVYRSSNGLPGALSEAQFRSDPRVAANPADVQWRDGYRLRPGVSAALGNSVTLEAELGVQRETSALRLPRAAGRIDVDRDRDTVSLTPRLRWQHDLGRLPSESVFGLDAYRGSVDAATSSPFGDNRQNAVQDSTAFYFQNITSLAEALHLTIGLREQRVGQEVVDEAAGLRANTSRSQSAYEAGLSYGIAAGSRLYVKAGKTFRFANTDELFGFDPLTFATIFRGDLRPQHGPIREVGGSARLGSFQLQASAYQLDLEDEIALDTTSFSNANFPATRRRGLEMEGRWQPSASFAAKLGVTRMEAKFTAGPFTGRTVPMVPSTKIAAGLLWGAGRAASYGVTATHVGARYFSGDLTNAQARLSSYTTVDVQASGQLGGWALTARVMNLFDRKYAAFGVLNFAGAPFYFPADPRTVLLTAKHDFK